MLSICRLKRFSPPIYLILYTIMVCYGVTPLTCPNATLTISCNITTPGPVTRWVVPPGNCPSNGIILSQPPGTDCGSKNDSCGPFVASNLVPPSGMACTTSVLSVVAAPQLNGTNISCYSNEILQYQHVISITIPPGLPLVTVRPMGNGLVVSCTPGANGDPLTSYDITVEPNGTHIITASNGMVEQNIPGLLPNTTYTVRVIAINCAGSSGVVTVNATTANGTAQLPLPSPATAYIAVGVAVGVPLIMIIVAALIIMLYKSYHSNERPSHTCIQQPLQPKPTLQLSKLPEGMFPELEQTFIILCTDAAGSSQVLEVEHIEFVTLKQRKTPPSDDQLWYRKDDQPTGSFAIVSKHNCKALKRDPESSQVVLRDVSEEGDQCVMEGNDIVFKTPSTLMYMYLGNHDVMYCGVKEKKEVKAQKKHFTFLEVKQNTSKIDHLYSIEDIENELVVTASKGPGCSQLVCSSNKLFREYWYKKFPDNTSDKYFLIVASTDGKLCAISCTTEGESRDRSDYLWKEEEEHIVSVRYGFVIGVQESEMEASLILCEREESKYKLKMVSLKEERNERTSDN